ncbi:hypothetical protein AAFF_G00418820 [Aldrovandia affinis]|uniref:Uncharacterized protein n=1 Tax=Aldrovandia affinis TaxID=143900 RepID=A0AAD7WJ85_9TELE|nr:hypothetical protein AAFF_G00418820 [Aldrovandia affinis]
MTKVPDLGVGPGSAPPPVSALASGHPPHSAAPYGQQAFGRGRVFGTPPAPGPGSPPVLVPAEESAIGGGEASCVGAGAALSEGGCPPPTAQDPETPKAWGDSKDPGDSGDNWNPAKQQRKRPLSGDSPGARDPKGPRNPSPTSSLDGFETENRFSPIAVDEEFSTEMALGMDLNLASPALPLDCSENKGAGEGGIDYSARALADLVRDFSLVDAFRATHPTDPGFTWRNSRGAESRLDYIFMGGGLSGVKTLRPLFTSVVEWWEAAKSRFATFCRRYAVVARRRDRAGVARWVASLAYLHGRLNTGEPVDWAVYEGAKERLRGCWRRGRKPWPSKLSSVS